MQFSVLMSLYVKEQPQFLVACLDSLVKQTVPATEIVLVFDGPLNDKLENIVAQFEQKLPLVIVRLAQNQGLGNALNEGLKHCQYEWVFRMDTDDICAYDRFERQINFIQKNPNTVIVGGQIAEFGQDITDIVSYRRVPTTESEIIKFTQKRCPFNHMTVAYRKSEVLACGGYQDVQEDYYLWIKLIALKQQVANLPDVLVYARVGNGMVKRRRGLSQAKAEWRLFKLKRKVGIHNSCDGLRIFVMRALPRLLPVSLLQYIYKFTRR